MSATIQAIAIVVLCVITGLHTKYAKNLFEVARRQSEEALCQSAVFREAL